MSLPVKLQAKQREVSGSTGTVEDVTCADFFAAKILELRAGLNELEEDFARLQVENSNLADENQELQRVNEQLQAEHDKRQLDGEIAL